MSSRVGTKTRLRWHRAIDKHRDNLDLGTIFWLWSQSERGFNPDKKLVELAQFYMEHIKHIDPRDLWGSLLGSSALVSEKQRIIDQTTKSAGKIIEVEGLGLCFDGARFFGDDSDRNRFDMTRWKSFLHKATNTRRNYGVYSIPWFVRYRLSLAHVVAFSDYWVADPSNSSDGEPSLVFVEDQIVEGIQDLIDIGVISSPDQLSPLNGMSKPSYQLFDPIMGKSDFTHSFINLDHFIEAADRFGYPIPDEIRTPGAASKSQPTSESPNAAIPTWDEGEQLHFSFEPGEEFRLLKMIPEILRFIAWDAECVEIRNDGRGWASKLRTRLAKELGVDYGESLEHIWRVVVSPAHRKHASGKELIGFLQEAKQALWDCDSLKEVWMRTSTNSRIELFVEAGFKKSEAKAILAVLTPESAKASGIKDDELLPHYKILIDAIDLSWTKWPPLRK